MVPFRIWYDTRNEHFVYWQTSHANQEITWMLVAPSHESNLNTSIRIRPIQS